MSWGETLFLKKIIDGKRSLAASDAVLKVLFSGDKTIGNNGMDLGSFVPKKNGSIRILAKGYVLEGNYNAERKLEVIVYQGETQVGKGVIYTPGNNSNNTYYNVSVDVPISSNVSYKVVCQRNSAGFRLTSAELCASVVDTSLVEVL